MAEEQDDKYWTLVYRPEDKFGDEHWKVSDDRRYFFIKEDTPWVEVLAFVDTCLREGDARRDGFELDEDGKGKYNYGLHLKNYETVDDFKRDLEVMLKRGRLASWFDGRLRELRDDLLAQAGLDPGDRITYWGDGRRE